MRIAAAVSVLVLGVWSAAAKSPTADEMAHHIANGYTYLKTGDLRMNPASPPLPRMVSALPLIAAGAKMPVDTDAWESGDSPAFAQAFFYEANTDADRMVFLARLPTVILCVIFVLSVSVFAERLAGPVPGMAAAILAATCPDILAHGSLATADLWVGCFFFLSLASALRYLEEPGRGSALRVGVLSGLTFLSKFSAIALGPTVLVTAVAAGKLRRLWDARVLLAVITAILVIWAGYLFEVKPLLKNTPDPLKKEAVYRRLGGESLVRFARETPVPLATFSSALVSMLHTRSQGTNAYLLGEWSRTGWPYYYPVAFFVKNTVPMTLLFLAGLLCLPRAGLGRARSAFLWAPIAFFVVATMNDRAQAGIRYFLPVYPLIITVASIAAALIWKNGRIGRMIIAALLAWHVASAVVRAPHFLSYFNEWAGGPSNGYRLLRDSNIDWGQDLKTLKARVERAGYGRIALYYPWPARPDAYGIEYRATTDVDHVRPERTVYAISAHGVDAFTWTKDREPDDHAGHSILIYDLREGEG